MNFEDILSRFEKPQRSGKGYRVLCPSHEDQISSLSIVETDTGKILLKCQAGRDTKKVIDAAGLRWSDLSNGTSRAASGATKNDPVVAKYVYVDETGKPLFRVCRTRSKTFFQQRFDAGSGSMPSRAAWSVSRP